jgi:hypothetical protein
MIHGRDHQEREQKIGGPPGGPSSNDGDEAEPVAAAPPGNGSQVAPTARATERERVRHEEERKRGRMAAGVDDNPRDRREPEVTREDLEEAARVADDAVGAGKG